MKKRRILVTILAGIMACVMLAGLVISALPIRANAASSSEIRREIDELEAQAAEIQSKQEDLQSEMNQNAEDTAGIVSQKDAIDQEIQLLHEKINNTNARIQSYNTLISEKQAELDDALQRQAELNEEYQIRIRAMEENGSLSYWSILFKANSFLDLLDQINMVSEIAKRDQEMMDELDAVATEIQEDQAVLEEDRASLETARDELEASQSELDEKREASDALLADLVAKADEMEEQFAALAEEEKALSDSIAASELAFTEQLRREQEATRPTEPPTESSSSGGEESGTEPSNNEESGTEPPDNGSSGSSGSATTGFMWPSYCTYITSPYGWRNPALGNGGWHTGIDIGASYGTEIWASKGGTVTRARWATSGYGNYVVINHYDGSSTLYGHMDHYCVSEGQTVSQGQVIGYVGSTGNSTGPHLHFNIYIDGATVNPLEYL